MGRREITAGLSGLLERHLESKTCVWAPEVSIETIGRCRPDYLSVSAYFGKFAGVSGIERAEVTAYEVKSCMADLKSGNGLNAVGDYNYIVGPYELMMDVTRRRCDGDESMPGGEWGWAYPLHRDYRKLRTLRDMPRYEGQTDGWGLYWVRPNQPDARRPQPIFVYLWALLHACHRQGSGC